MRPIDLSALRFGATTVLLLAAASIAAAEDAAPDTAQTVTIRGEEMRVWPAEDLIARGMDVKSVPRAENAAWTYIEAANAYADLPADLTDAFDYAVGKAWPADQKGLADYLASEGTRKAIDLTIRASRMEKCQMPYFGDCDGSLIAMLLPNLSHMRFLSKLLVAEGRRLEAEGKYDQAFDLYLAAMRMGGHAADGVTLIESLVGVAVWHLGDKAAVEMVMRRDLTDKQLRRVAAEFEKIAPRVPTAEKGLQGEQNFGPDVVDEVFSRPFNVFGNINGLLSYGGGADSNARPKEGWSRFEKRLGKVIFPDRAIKKNMSEFYAAQQMIATRPMSDEARGFNEEKFINEKTPRWDVVSRTMLPSLSRAISMGLSCKAHTAAGMGVVAVRRHQLAHKAALPASLADLKEFVALDALVDPFSGEPLLYRQDAEGWVVYSVGPNMTDDGGIETDKQRWDSFDVAYRFPAPVIEPFRAGGAE